jgi:hypothetical protein
MMGAIIRQSSLFCNLFGILETDVKEGTMQHTIILRKGRKTTQIKVLLIKQPEEYALHEEFWIEIHSQPVLVHVEIPISENQQLLSVT